MSILQEFLNLGLVGIGSDDSRFAKMEAVGAVFVKHLLSNPALVIPATLIAIDRDADEDDPILTLVDEQLVNEWKTIRNAHINKPRELLRSIIIQALSVLGLDKPRMAALIWQTAFSPINHNQARLGKEGELVRKLLQDFQKRSADAAPARGSFSEPPPLKKDRKRKSIQSYTQLKDEDIVTDIGRSAGPNGSAARQPIQLPDNDHITGAKLIEEPEELGPVPTSPGSLVAKDACAPSRLQRGHLSSGVLIVCGNAGVTDQHCIKVSLITLVLQYRFATPKPLKTRSAPDHCKTVPLCNRPVVDSMLAVPPPFPLPG